MPDFSIPPNQLLPSLQGGGSTPSGNQFMPSSSAPKITQQQVDEHHARMSDFQEDLKELLKLPDSDLDLHRVFGMAADLVSKHELSHGKRGATGMQVAGELSSPDFPKDLPNGDPPPPQAIRKFLLNHFIKNTATQAELTRRFGPPSQASVAQQPTQQPQGIGAQ